MFHRALPRAVRRVKTGRGMRSTPAGTEIRLRKTGIIRPKKIALVPCRRNHASVRSMSETLTRGSLAAMATVRSRPRAAPTP